METYVVVEGNNRVFTHFTKDNDEEAIRFARNNYDDYELLKVIDEQPNGDSVTEG